MSLPCELVDVNKVCSSYLPPKMVLSIVQSDETSQPPNFRGIILPVNRSTMLPTLPEVEEDDCKMLSVEEKWKLVFKQEHGPPMYRPEEYSVHLQRWLSEGATQYSEEGGTIKEQKNNNRGDPNDNVYLNELSSIADLLKNLKIDLKLAHISFHESFLEAPHTGMNLLLNSLKTLTSFQSSKNTKGSNLRDIIQMQKRALSDEYQCLLCIKHTVRHPDALKMIREHSSGLYILAMSSLGNYSKSRIVALELLTLCCETPNGGHDAVMKAMSAVRLTMGEPVRFKLLVGMLNSPTNGTLTFQATCLNFLNTILETTRNACERVYLQCEIEEAGLEVKQLEKFSEMKESDDFDQYMEALRFWRKNYVDVENLVYLSKRLASDNSQLRSEVEVLKKTTKKLEEDKINLMIVERELTEQCVELEDRISSMKRKIAEQEAQVQLEKRERERRRPDFRTLDVNQNDTARGTASSNSPEAMSISSEEAHRIITDVIIPEPVATDSELIVPHIQKRNKTYIWGGKENNEEKQQQQQRNPPPSSRQPPNQRIPAKHPLVQRNSNSDYASLATEKEEEDWYLSWTYPDIPQPIAIVTPGKNCLQDMNEELSRHNQADNQGPRMLSLEFHKALFQRSNPMPPAHQKVNKAPT